ncbi:hypothetical protein IQ07DRAFT_560609 [Pyrenochaeta sp. DS3sAY3a]|nr:hypothetical protein IQ07DRAFT_560609 [Pyrenochaeta sp. DS3sAY3a]
MAQDIEHVDPTVFMPHGSLGGLSGYFDRIPHYLFRTSSPRSSGTTTETIVASAAVKHHLDQSDILGRYWEEAVEMLESHLLWQNRMDDNLMSWTNSFLFAAQHAIRREATDRPASAPESIYISILDTREFPRGTFLPAVALLQAYSIESTGKLRHDYYYGEYLSQGRLSGGTIMNTTLDKLIAHGLYRLYPPFADDSERSRLCLRVLQLRETFTDTPKESTHEEIKIAERISVGCFLHIGIRPVIMMTLLSLKPRYRLEPRILEAFKDNRWGTFVSDCSIECYRTTSEHVPEHRQFTDMMHDVHAFAQRERQIERATRDAAKATNDVSDLTNVLDQLHLTRDRFGADRSGSNTSIMSKRVDGEQTCQKDMQGVNTGTTIKKIIPSSPKTMMIEMMEEEEEEQQRALDQIEDCYEETKPCPECAGHISETCFRRNHFGWCMAHELMIDEDEVCPRNLLDDASPSVMRCIAVYCDKTENEAYWAEVEKNAMIGGAGFREPGEPHVH